tara:strand:+ start:493 stop:1791 length:1299 start_codon:yes stop_codon:yes gene_type:complete
MSKRFKYTYSIESYENILNKLLFISDTVPYINILVSNSEFQSNILPKEYINYDLIAGVDSLTHFSSNKDCLKSLKDFHNKHKDWLFGHISYGLKNEIESLNDKNQNINDKLHFFVPKFLLFIKKNTLEVLTYESKENTDKFINIIPDFEYEKTDNIKLSCVESKEKYIKKINLIKENIQRGDIYEMNYCTEFFAKNVNIKPQQLFLKINSSTRSPFAAFMKLNDNFVLCASPERFLKKNCGVLISQPIKGTSARGSTVKEDNFLCNKLNNSEKDIAENIMIVDLVRNDLSKISKKSSVIVDELCNVYGFEYVYQMISTISSKVKSNIHFTDILMSTFPMGSMTGAPKLRAMELIDSYEQTNRNFYSGSLGYIDPYGDFDFNVIIRTIVYNTSQKYLSVGVGGAITAKSEPELEYKECLIKIKPIIKALNDYE